MARTQRTAHPLPPRTVPCRGDELIPANRLDGKQRHQLWQYIQTSDPNMKAFLEDPIVSGLVKQSGAVVLFPPDLVEAALGHSQLLALKV